jgi:FAD/FMN-containing dehydrogenase
MTHPLLTDLAAQLPPAALVTDPEKLAPRLIDERRRLHGSALAMAMPGSTEEAALIVQRCITHGVAIVPQAGNTGLVGGATPMSDKALLMVCDHLNRVRQVDADGYVMTVEAGCTLDEVRAAAEQANRLFPLWLGSSASARVGGLIGTNAGGLQVLRYGNMRELVLGIEAVLPDGQIYRGLHSLRKRNVGYDFAQLLIGAEGTLGFVTAASLRLFPSEQGRATAMVALNDASAVLRLFSHAQAEVGEVLTAFEYMGRAALEIMAAQHGEVPQPFNPIPNCAVLIALSGSQPDSVLEDRLAQLLMAAGCEDAILAQDGSQTDHLWALRELIPSAQRRAGPSIKQDLALPIGAIPDFIEEAAQKVAKYLPQATPVVFGHMGDGNLHYNLSLPHDADFAASEAISNEVLFDLVAKYDGDISAEHGIGRFRVAAADDRHDPLARELMRKIKQSLDPQGLFNPGVLI